MYRNVTLAIFVLDRADRQAKQQPFQGVMLKVSVQNFKAAPCKSSLIVLALRIGAGFLALREGVVCI